VRGVVVTAIAVLLVSFACDDSIAPKPPKQANQPPQTALVIQSDSLSAQLYELGLAWSGSDADGDVDGFRYRWTCLDLGGATCPAPEDWQQTRATRDTFRLFVPNPTASYRFEVAAVDDDGVFDPTPATQDFALRNSPPLVSFAPNTVPTRSLPAVTFYLVGADPDSSVDAADADAARSVARYRAWLDGSEGMVIDVPARPEGVTLGPEDFAGRYDMRTVFLQAVDDGGAVSATIQHTWQVDTPIPDGILLVDDCRQGGNYETVSDQSYRNALEAAAPGRTVVLDVETIPVMSRADFEAILSLFVHVVWYTDADTDPSGALELARAGLDSVLAGGGHVILSSGLAFGTGGAFGVDEPRFRDLFGIETLFLAADSTTNFSLSQADTVEARVTPGLSRFRFLTIGLGDVMECFGSRQDAATRSLYFYPESTFVRGDSLPYVNPVQYDIGVHHEMPGGARTVFVSFPLGLPVNDNMGENEAEIRELLRLAGMIGP
jgi:hypothetical protein